jgi:glucose/arabinose dehydrogenase
MRPPVRVRIVALSVCIGVALGASRGGRVEPGGAPPAGRGPLHVRGFSQVIDGDTVETLIDGKRVGIGRVTATGDTADPSSEVVILGTVVGGSCNAFPAGSDCIPSDSPSHSIGAIKFAADGTLLVAIGDGASFKYVDDDALRAQNLDSLAGKVLRVTSSRAGLPTNSFWNGQSGTNRSKVWAYGLRNPFRFNLRPDSAVPYLGDVGWDNWEEIDVAAAGANLGWPCYEGTAIQGGYKPKLTCQGLYSQRESAARPAVVSYRHYELGAAAVGGTFYTGTAYPAEYQGRYF